jgi:hypothetical protein
MRRFASRCLVSARRPSRAFATGREGTGKTGRQTCGLRRILTGVFPDLLGDEGAERGARTCAVESGSPES